MQTMAATICLMCVIVGIMDQDFAYATMALAALLWANLFDREERKNRRLLLGLANHAAQAQPPSSPESSGAASR